MPFSSYATFQGFAAGLIGGGGSPKLMVKRTLQRRSEADIGERQFAGHGPLAEDNPTRTFLLDKMPSGISLKL